MTPSPFRPRRPPNDPHLSTPASTHTARLSPDPPDTAEHHGLPTPRQML